MMKNQNFPTDNTVGQAQDNFNGLLLEQMNLHIGDPIQLQVGNTCHFATLIGYLDEQSFIVTTPNVNETPIQINEDMSLVARFFIDKRAYAFNTVVQHVASEPFLHLHLAYPKGIQALKERQHDRVRVNISGTADIPDGKSFSCVVQDLSIGGALIALRNQTGEINDPLLLTLRVVINGVEYELSLDSEIRSVRVGDPSNDGDTPVLHGVAFNDLSEPDILALAAFDLLPDWKATA